MKIRNGFVSNSSSSSFIAVLKKSVLDGLDLEPSEKVLLDKLSKVQKLSGEDMVVFSSISGNIDSLEYEDVVEFSKQVVSLSEKLGVPVPPEFKETYEEDDDLLYEACNKLKEKFWSLTKKGLCIIHTEDF